MPQEKTCVALDEHGYYNIYPIPGGSSGRTVTEETRKKLSEANRNQTRTDVQRERMKKAQANRLPAMRNRYGKLRSAEYKHKHKLSYLRKLKLKHEGYSWNEIREMRKIINSNFDISFVLENDLNLELYKKMLEYDKYITINQNGELSESEYT